MVARFEVFMVVCCVVFALISVSNIGITIIKFIRYIRAELKGEYGDVSKALIIASVVGAIIVIVLSTLAAYISIEAVVEIAVTRGQNIERF